MLGLPGVRGTGVSNYINHQSETAVLHRLQGAVQAVFWAAQETSECELG